MKRYARILGYSLVLFLIPVSISAQVEKIILWEHLWPVHAECTKVLLDRTVDEYGPYELVKSESMEQGRAIQSLIGNKLVNLLILPTDREREEVMLPVHIYVKGHLMGYRVLLIPKGTQFKYDTIYSIKDFNQLTLSFGSGTHWTDTKILEANGIKVVTSASYENLYYMLAKERFDGFPRGLNQIKNRMEKYGPEGEGLDIEVEQRLLFYYPLREIFFVSPDNIKLKERLESGYEQAYRDGSWQNCISQFIDYDLEGLNLKERILIPLENPFLTEEAINMEILHRDPLD